MNRRIITTALGSAAASLLAPVFAVADEVRHALYVMGDELALLRKDPVLTRAVLGQPAGEGQ